MQKGLKRAKDFSYPPLQFRLNYYYMHPFAFIKFKKEKKL